MSKLNNLKSRAKESVEKGLGSIKASSISAAAGVTAISSEELAKKFTEFYSDLANRFLSAQATVYDKALDAEYIESKMGGAYHRLFDEGHDLFDAWDKVRNAKSDDSFVAEIVGYTSALTKDLVTKMGIPLKTIDKDSFDQLVEKMSLIPGVDREYLYDLFTVNAAELTASGLSAVGLFLAFKSDDYEKVSEILGALGVSSIMAANPILGMITLAAASFSYKRAKIRSDKVALGACVSVLGFTMFAVLGLPFLVELAIVMIVSSYAKRSVLSSSDLMLSLKQRIAKIDLSDAKTLVAGQLKNVLKRVG